jgi:hypothetical protein
MVGREEKERDQHARDGDSATDQHYALGFVIVGGEQLVMKKSVKNVAHQDLELALLALVASAFRLHGERENGMLRRSEESGSLRHCGPP